MDWIVANGYSRSVIGSVTFFQYLQYIQIQVQVQVQVLWLTRVQYVQVLACRMHGGDRQPVRVLVCTTVYQYTRLYLVILLHCTTIPRYYLLVLASRYVVLTITTSITIMHRGTISYSSSVEHQRCVASHHFFGFLSKY
jgi:hypothetical protein